MTRELLEQLAEELRERWLSELDEEAAPRSDDSPVQRAPEVTMWGLRDLWEASEEPASRG
jgi:hypothetical protein